MVKRGLLGSSACLAAAMLAPPRQGPCFLLMRSSRPKHLDCGLPFVPLDTQEMRLLPCLQEGDALAIFVSQTITRGFFSVTDRAAAPPATRSLRAREPHGLERQ